MVTKETYCRSVAIAVALTLSSSQAVIERFFSEPRVNAVLASSGFSSEQLIAQVMTLSDTDLARDSPERSVPSKPMFGPVN
jgi:hypothetical protein